MRFPCSLPLWLLPLFVLGVACQCDGVEPNVSVRQLIVRAPERLVLNALKSGPTEEAMAALVLGWVEDKRATIISELAGMAGKRSKVIARSGRVFKNAVEYEQDLDKGSVTPTGWEDVLIGTSLEVSVDDASSTHAAFQVDWKTSFSPRAELAVTWPAWWPTIPKPPVNWFETHDFHVEKVVTSADLETGGTAILGIMRRSDALDGKAGVESTLDLVLAQSTSGAKAIAAVPQALFTVLGFGLKDREVLDLLDRPSLQRDKTLLDELLAKVAAGEAQLRICCALNQKDGARASLESARLHSYPCEMHTIPSSWATQPVGTMLETDPSFPSMMTIALEHHPAPPRKAEWICALDMPSLIMWLPQFFKQRISTSLNVGKSGVALLGAMRNPDCITGEKGLTAGESLLLFAKLDDSEMGEGVVKVEAHSSQRIELEAIVFEVPRQEEAEWQPDPNTLDDKLRLATLLARIRGGTARLAAHVAVATSSGMAPRVSTVEEVMTVTDIDPPENQSPQRYRPTCTEVIPCGTIWEVDPVLRKSSNPFDHGAVELHLRHKLQHHVARPVEPTCQQIIDSTRANGFEEIPKAVISAETWEGEVTLRPGTLRCIGTKRPPQDAHGDKLHVAFIRARVAE